MSKAPFQNTNYHYAGIFGCNRPFELRPPHGVQTCGHSFTTPLDHLARLVRPHTSKETRTSKQHMTTGSQEDLAVVTLLSTTRRRPAKPRQMATRVTRETSSGPPTCHFIHQSGMTPHHSRPTAAAVAAPAAACAHPPAKPSWAANQPPDARW